MRLSAALLSAALAAAASAAPAADDALRVLKDRHAWGRDKIEAMYPFLESDNFSEEAFWTLLDNARLRSHPDADKPLRPEGSGYPRTFRASALFFLSTALAYSHPDDFDKGRQLIRLVRDERFKKAMAELAGDHSAEVRQQRHYLLGALTVNTRVELIRVLAPDIVPLILSGLAAPDEGPVLSDGLWALEQYMDAGARLSAEHYNELGRLARQAPDPQVRESLRLLIQRL